MRNYRVTGPVEVPRSTLDRMVAPMISHRATGFRERLAVVTARLGEVFGTGGTVVPLTCSGTGGLEAAVASVLRPGDRVLSVRQGYFGTRFAQIATHHRMKVDVLAAPWGEVVSTAELATAARGGHDAILLTHNETSTGVLAPLREWLAAIRAETDCLVLVDVVSSLAATEIAFDELGLDVAVGVTQKALACPPGLSLVAMSDRAVEFATRPGAGSYYLDLGRAVEHIRERTTTYTPALSVIFALEAALADLAAEGNTAVWQRHAATAARCRDALRANGLAIVPGESVCSPTVTAVRLPVPRAEEIRAELAAEHDVWVSSGRGPWKSTVLRIGHMGPVDPADIDACAAAIGEVTRSTSAR